VLPLDVAFREIEEILYVADEVPEIRPVVRLIEDAFQIEVGHCDT
jgi:hypothetical protein